MACVILAPLKDGTISFRGKWTNAKGRQRMDTIGNTRDGWTEELAQAEANRREAAERECPTFRVYARGWWKRGDWAPSTVRAYKAIIDRAVARFGNLPLYEVTEPVVTDHVAKLRAECRYADSTLEREHRVLVEILVDGSEDFKLGTPLTAGLVRANRIRADVLAAKVALKAQIESQKTKRLAREGPGVAAAYQQLRRLIDTVDRTIPSLTGTARREVQAAMGSLHVVEDRLGHALRDLES